jgi:hypothetical protein
MSDVPHLQEAGPQIYRGDLFTHVRSGHSGVVERVLPGGIVDVSVFRGASLPNNSDGRSANVVLKESAYERNAADFHMPNTLTVDSIQIRRPAVGTRFELHPLRPNSGSGEVEVHRLLTNGYLEVVDVADRSVVFRVHTTELYADAEERLQPDPSQWPVVQL